MTLKIAYDDQSEHLIDKLAVGLLDYPLIKMETFHEMLFKERKKAFKLKGEFGARKTPFAALYDDNKTAIICFYSESNDCEYEKIISRLNKWIVYNNKNDKKV